MPCDEGPARYRRSLTTIATLVLSVVIAPTAASVSFIDHFITIITLSAAISRSIGWGNWPQYVLRRASKTAFYS